MKSALLIFFLIWTAQQVDADDLANSAAQPYGVQLSNEIPLPDATFELGSDATYPLPALPAKPGMIPVFRAHIFLQTPVPGGFNGHAQIKLNGSILGRHMQDGSERLLLRSPTFDYLKSSYQVFMANPLSGDLIDTMFAPSADTADAITGDHLGATYLLNLSDLARGVDNNVLKVTGNIRAADAGIGRVENASVGWLDRTIVAPPTIMATSRPMPALQVTDDGVTLGAARNGGVAIVYQGDLLCLETSDNGGDQNRLTVEDAPVSSPAAVTNSRIDAQTIQQDVKWPDGLTIRRTFQIGPNHRVIWKEIWTNTTSDDKAVPYSHRLFISGHAPNQIILGGDPDSDARSTASTNPTLFMGDRAAKAGFGFVAEDDWQRNLMQLRRAPLGGNIFSRNLMLGEGQSISFESSLQLQPSDSYWDFINDLRQRWGVNSVTIDRAIFWGLATPQSKGEGGSNGDPATLLTSEVASKGPLYAMIPPWLGIEPDAYAANALDAKSGGQALTADQMTDFYQYKHRPLQMKAMQSMANTLRTSPNVRIMVEMHPAMEIAYLPLFDLYPFHDAAIMTESQQPFQDGGYTKSWLTTAADHGWAVVYVAPTKNNAFSQQLVQRIRDAIDVYKADAIYSDEFSFVGATRGYSRYDYRQPDGYSAILDDDDKIAAKVTDLGLATIANQLAMIHAAQERGKPMLVNTAPATRAVQTAGIWHFVEGGNGYWSGANTHLTTPLVLGNVGDPKSQSDVFKLTLGILQTGNLQVPNSTNLYLQGRDNFISREYPITPQRIGPGYVLGPERLITSQSLEFPWPGEPATIQVYTYDSGGNFLGKKPGTLTPQNTFAAKVPDGGLLIAEVLPTKS